MLTWDHSTQPFDQPTRHQYAKACMPVYCIPSDLAVELLWKPIPSAPVQLENWDAVFFNFANIGAYFPHLLTTCVEVTKEPVFELLLSFVSAECNFTNVLTEGLYC